MPNYFTAIIVAKVHDGKMQFAKYRNIPASKETKLVKFAVRTFPGLHHINLYDKTTRRFIKQIGKTEINAVCYVGQ